MFLTERKLESRIHELSDYRYRDSIEIKRFDYAEDMGELAAYPPETYGPLTMQIGDIWRGRDKYLWLHKDVDVPKEWDRKKILGIFNFGRTGGGNNSGFESLLFVNGQPLQGVDSNHQEVFLPKEYIGEKVRLDFRLWSGLEGGGKPQEQIYTLETAKLCWLDEYVDDLYFTSLAILQAIQEMEVHQADKQMLTKLLNEAYLLVDWSIPGCTEFYESCKDAIEFLRKNLSEVEKHHPVTVHCIGHTHIDVAWLWRLKHTREKAARSFSTVLQLMDQYPEYYFLQTQPQLYEYIKNDYPEIYEKMKHRIQEGRWETEGSMWLEADCNIPSGESLVRQILYGKNFMKNEFNIECKYLWLPDVFGYSWALPQILKKSGIDTFMTTKISWNQYNRMPHDTFHWRGIDGSEILTHFITTPEPWNPADSWFYTYNGLITAKTVNGAWKSYRDKDVSQDLLLSYGYGDGGGGVNREMIELRRRLDEIPGIPNVKTTKAGEFFKLLHKRVEETKSYVHMWDGELYLEYHRGTYTSQAHNKRMNRKLELAYRESEWLNVWSSIEMGWDLYPKQDLDEGWKIILRNQFHDIIPGSSIKEVYEDSKEEYVQAMQIVEKVTTHALNQLVEDSGKGYSIFNSSHWTDAPCIHIPYDHLNSGEGRWVDCQGNGLKSQKTENGWMIVLDEVHPFGMNEVFFHSSLVEMEPELIPFIHGEKNLETPFYLLEWNDFGQLVRIYDKEAGREVLSPTKRGNVLQVFEDKPIAHDAWDIDLFYQEKFEEIQNVISQELIEKGPVRTVIRTKWQYRNTIIEQDMMVYAKSKRIDFQTNVDWHEQQKLLKTQFSVDVRTTEATYDIQFGNVKRNTHWNTSWDMARFENVGHQWADLSEPNYGVSLLNDCKYGYDIKDNNMRLSLIKSAIHPDPTADQGEHTFTYSLFSHQGDWRQGNTVKEAWYLNNPLRAVLGKATIEHSSFMNLDAEDHVLIDTIKRLEAEDGVVVRLHEYKGNRGIVNIHFAQMIKGWLETNLMEVKESDIRTEPIQFEIKPYEIKTFAVYFK